MPFKVEKSGRKWKVTGRKGKVHGTHATKKSAEKQATAIRGHYYGFFESMGVKPWQQFLNESRELEQIRLLLEGQDIDPELAQRTMARLQDQATHDAYFQLQRMWFAAQGLKGRTDMGELSKEFRVKFWAGGVDGVKIPDSARVREAREALFAEVKDIDIPKPNVNAPRTPFTHEKMYAKLINI